MCWRSEYDYYARMSSKPASSRPERSLVEVLRTLFRPRRARVEQADVIAFPAEVASRSDEGVERKDSKAA